MYTLLYDGQFVENPIRFQLVNALELLFSRRKPMTLVFRARHGPRPQQPD